MLMLLYAAKLDRMDSVSLMRSHARAEILTHFLMGFILLRCSTKPSQQMLIMF